jgi:polar amino acid transport system substrate-binding protein
MSIDHFRRLVLVVKSVPFNTLIRSWMISMCAKFNVLLAAVFLSAALPLHAKETLIIGVENQPYLPTYAYENGVYIGFARELFDAFAQDRGYALEYRALPVPRLYASFFEGQIDFKFPDNPRWKQEQREKKTIHYSDPIVAYVDGVSTLPHKKTTKPDDIKRLGTMRGFTPWAWIDRIESGKTILSENTQLAALIRQTQVGRIDGIYANVAVINYQLDHILKRPGALTFNPGLPSSRDYYYLATLKRPEVLTEFNQWMHKNRTQIAALKQKYAVEKGVIAPAATSQP